MLRVSIDALIQIARKDGVTDAPSNLDADLYLRSDGLVITNLIEAKMWAGKMLEALGTPFPAELADKAPTS